jgi:hypothetical protein
MNHPRACTSACVLNKRYIYIFPGSWTGSWNTIEMMDVGMQFDHKVQKGLKWVVLSVNLPEFNFTYSYGSAAISENEILLFGGGKKNTFILDTSESTPTKDPKVRIAKMSN